jgi:hypothetical protein
MRKPTEIRARPSGSFRYDSAPRKNRAGRFALSAGRQAIHQQCELERQAAVRLTQVDARQLRDAL